VAAQNIKTLRFSENDCGPYNGHSKSLTHCHKYHAVGRSQRISPPWFRIRARVRIGIGLGTGVVKFSGSATLSFRGVTLGYLECQVVRYFVIFTARCYAVRGIATESLSVRLSVRLPVTLRYRDRIIEAYRSGYFENNFALNYLCSADPNGKRHFMIFVCLSVCLSHTSVTHHSIVERRRKFIGLFSAEVTPCTWQGNFAIKKSKVKINGNDDRPVLHIRRTHFTSGK